MTYVAVKGGERAIANAESLLQAKRRGDGASMELACDQIDGQLSLAVDRVMCEGSLYDRGLASLAVKQSWGDLVEAIFLLRAYRTTLPRLYESVPLDTGAMDVIRRVSSIFKDVPGGQLLGPTFDYTHRLLDFALTAQNGARVAPSLPGNGERVSRAIDLLADEGLISQPVAPKDEPPADLTREPIAFPIERATWLQNLARGYEGFLLALGYSTQRGFGKTHPFAGEIRVGTVEVVIACDEVGFELTIAAISLTEVQMVNQFTGTDAQPPQFTRGYGLTFGYNERKAMAMALVDRALQSRDLGERTIAPAQDIEFVTLHSDNVEAQGFVSHLKLPHYVDFQSELGMIRDLRREREGAPAAL